MGENILPVQPYGERAVKTGGGEADPVFADLTVDARGILTAIDSVSARVYQYDPAGNLLTVFGGKGSGKGYLSSPRAIAQDSGGSLYSYDANLNTIQVYRPTAFLESVHRAVALYDGGEYDKAQAAWEEVLSTGGSYSLAYIGLGDACYKNEAYEEAMEHYYTARDEAGYAKAFSKYRYRWFKENFLWAVLAAAAIAAAFLTAGRLLIRLSARFERLYLSTIGGRTERRGNSVRSFYLVPTVLVHPIDTFRLIQRDRSRFNYLPPVILLLLIPAVRLFNVYVTHFSLATVDVWETTVWMEITKLLLPVVSFILMEYAVTTILGGESLFREILLAVSLAFVPYLVFSPLLACLSRILCGEERALYLLLSAGIWLWVGLLIWNSFRVMNSYTPWQATGVVALTVVGMAILWAICVLIYALGNQLLDFFTGILAEIRIRFMQ